MQHTDVTNSQGPNGGSATLAEAKETNFTKDGTIAQLLRRRINIWVVTTSVIGFGGNDR
jgi:hypothetical protein